MTLFVGVCGCPARIMPIKGEGPIVCAACGEPWINATMLALRLRVLAKNLSNLDPEAVHEFAADLHLASKVMLANRAGTDG